MAAADRILEALRPPIHVADSRLSVSASLGVAMNATAQETADGLVRNADAAMYRAKAAGKGRRELFDPETAAPSGITPMKSPRKRVASHRSPSRASQPSGLADAAGVPLNPPNAG
jgi:predicted signal transduction protein with EAL and GGDEF domain